MAWLSGALAVLLAALPAGSPVVVEPSAQSGPKQNAVQQDFDEPPRVRKQARPKYPKAAFQAGIQGTVLIEAIVDAKGRISAARVIQSVPGLDEAALDACRKWRFHPATKAGAPVPTIIHMPVKFVISVEKPPTPAGEASPPGL